MKLYLVKLPLYRRAAVDEVIELDDGEAERLMRIGAVEPALADEPSLEAMCAAIAAATTAEGIVGTWSSPIPEGVAPPMVQQAPVEPAPKPAKAARKPAKA